MNYSGIYEIVNTTNQKRYIGSTKCMRRRRYQHWHDLRSDDHRSRHLQHAWNFYGEDVFEFRPIMFCEEFELLYYEQKLLDLRHPEYNISKEAGRNAMAGWHHTEEAKARIGASSVGRTKSPEVKAKMSAAKKGKKFTDEHRAKLKLARQAQPLHTHCKWGHPYSGPESDVYVTPTGKRQCKHCKRMRGKSEQTKA